jgi:arginyl-tRNA synthetase
VIRKAQDNGITFGDEIPVTDMHAKEKMLLVNIYNWPALLEQAAINRSPAMIANYIYDLAKDFNQFYQECSIMKEDDAKRREFRLQLADMTAKLLRNASGLLGISMPEKM